MATVIPTQRVLPRGIGAAYTPLVAAMTVTAGPNAFVHIRNRGAADVTVTVMTPTDDVEGLNLRNVAITIPAGTERFCALPLRVADNTGTITIAVSGDLSAADVAALDRP